MGRGARRRAGVAQPLTHAGFAPGGADRHGRGMSSDDEQPGRGALAEDRTDLAEDRTLLANERTFGGWARTAMAAIGIGVGFNALFAKVEPSWVAKAIATVFILLGIFLVIAAERRAAGIQDRLTAHQVTNVPRANFRVMSIAVTIGAAGLIVAIWWLA